MSAGVGVAEPDVQEHVHIDDDVLGDLDEDWLIPCEIPALARENGSGYPHCDGEPAVWIAWRIGCCGPRFRLVCDHCRRVYEKWKAHQAYIICGACKEYTGGFVRYTPLKE